jgi:hypothetical protein
VIWLALMTRRIGTAVPDLEFTSSPAPMARHRRTAVDRGRTTIGHVRPGCGVVTLDGEDRIVDRFGDQAESPRNVHDCKTHPTCHRADTNGARAAPSSHTWWRSTRRRLGVGGTGARDRARVHRQLCAGAVAVRTPRRRRWRVGGYSGDAGCRRWHHQPAETDDHDDHDEHERAITEFGRPAGPAATLAAGRRELGPSHRRERRIGRPVGTVRRIGRRGGRRADPRHRARRLRARRHRDRQRRSGIVDT